MQVYRVVTCEGNSYYTFRESFWNCSSIFLTRHTIEAEYYGIPSGVYPTTRTSFPDNTSYIFHRVALNLGGQ